MLYQVLIAAGLVIFLGNLVLNLKNLRVPDSRARIPGPVPLVSVLVPARDEAANIGALPGIAAAAGLSRFRGAGAGR